MGNLVSQLKFCGGSTGNTLIGGDHSVYSTAEEVLSKSFKINWMLDLCQAGAIVLELV